MIKYRPIGNTGRLLGMFRDRFGASCSVQESSYPDEPCIWLGVENDTYGDPVSNGRMHLSREQAKELIDALRYFVNEGTLGQYGPEDYRVGTWVVGVGPDNHGVHGRILEINEHHHIVVQDTEVYGAKGRHTCLWEQIPQVWVPGDAPPEGLSIYDQLAEEL